MSAIVEAALDHRLSTVIGIRILGEDKAAPRLELLASAGRAITSASQAAASGNVIAGAPRTWAVRWLSRSGRAIAIVDGADATCFGTDERETYDYRRRNVFRCRPCWDATARVWRWGSPACDPRGCAWPRPWVGGEVRRG